MRLLKLVLLLSVTVWVGGTVLILWGGTPQGCAWPYRTYAWTWPLWVAFRDYPDALSGLVKFSLRMCP
jgi:hypothetical protein